MCYVRHTHIAQSHTTHPDTQTTQRVVFQKQGFRRATTTAMDTGCTIHVHLIFDGRAICLTPVAIAERRAAKSCVFPSLELPHKKNQEEGGGINRRGEGRRTTNNRQKTKGQRQGFKTEPEPLKTVDFRFQSG